MSKFLLRLVSYQDLPNFQSERNQSMGGGSSEWGMFIVFVWLSFYFILDTKLSVL